jgi:hypothetical protein
MSNTQQSQHLAFIAQSSPRQGPRPARPAARPQHGVRAPGEQGLRLHRVRRPPRGPGDHRPEERANGVRHRALAPRPLGHRRPHRPLEAERPRRVPPPGGRRQGRRALARFCGRLQASRRGARPAPHARLRVARQGQPSRSPSTPSGRPPGPARRRPHGHVPRPRRPGRRPRHRRAGGRGPGRPERLGPASLGRLPLGGSDPPAPTTLGPPRHPAWASDTRGPHPRTLGPSERPRGACP